MDNRSSIKKTDDKISKISRTFEPENSIPKHSKHKTRGIVLLRNKKDFAFGDENSDYTTSSHSVINHTRVPKFRNDQSDSKDTVQSQERPSESSTLTDSTELAEGLSTGSILELYDTTIRSDNANLKRVQLEIKRDYESCFLKLELATIAILCSTSAKLLLKPCPKFFMVNNEPCYEELKSILKHVKSLKNILTSKQTALLENRMLIDVLHWIFFESKLPSFIEIKFNQIQNELHKIDMLKLPLKPALITKIRYGQFSNQEVDHRYFLKYLRQSREEFDIRLGYIAVHMQLLYQVLADGIDILIKDKKGVAVHTNMMASIESIQDNVYYLMNSNYNSGSNIVFEYFAILVTEVVVQKDTESYHKQDLAIYRNILNVADCIYYVRNIKRIKTKFILFFKIGSSKMVKKLLNINNKMEAKFVIDSQLTCHQGLRPDNVKSHGERYIYLALSLSMYFTAIFISILCFIWYMKTWRHF
ncbi:hypothetical protein WDU94_010819 [Cyamophila willieti]